MHMAKLFSAMQTSPYFFSLEHSGELRIIILRRITLVKITLIAYHHSCIFYGDIDAYCESLIPWHYVFNGDIGAYCE